MAPTLIINRATGGSFDTPGTFTNITSTTNRANAADDPSNGTTDPIQIPASGTNYSYAVTTQLQCTVAPPTLVDNLAWYTSGSNPFGAGIDCYATTDSVYYLATGTLGVSGLSLAGLGYAAGSEVFSNYTSGSPLAVSGSTSTTGMFGHYVHYSITVGSSATAGVVAGPATFTWAYEWY